MPHQLENIIKIINDKNFDSHAYLSQGNLSDFFTQLIDYLHQYGEKNRKEGKLFKKTKYPDYKAILSAFVKVMKHAKYQHYKDFLSPLVKVFCQFLHSETPQVYRTPIISIVMKMAGQIPEDQLDIIFPVFAFIVPYPSCMSPEDSMNFKALINSVYKAKIIDASQLPPTPEEADADLGTLLKFYLKNWSTRVDFCAKSFYEHVLFVLYRTQAEMCQCKCPNYGFNGEPPLGMRKKIAKVLRDFISENQSFDKLLTSSEKCHFLISICRQGSTTNDLTMYVTILDFLTKSITVPHILDTILEITANESNCILNEMINVICLFLSKLSHKGEPIPNNILDLSSTFMTGYYLEIHRRFPKEEFVRNISLLFRNNINLQYPIAYLLLSLFHFLVTMHEWDQSIWELIIQLISENETLSVVASHYAQYLAVYLFPLIYDIKDEAEATSVCLAHMQRKQRTKQESVQDFVAQHMTKILTRPELFTNEFPIQSFLKIQKNYAQLISLLKIEPLIITERKRFFDDAMNFLEKFQIYSSINSKISKRIVFAPLYDFCSMVSNLKYIPYGVQCNRTAAYSLCANILFKGIMVENDIEIRPACFDLLSKLINSREISMKLDDQDLTNWYISLCLMLFLKNDEYSSKGLYQAVKTIQIGFLGSAALCGIIMNMFEKNRFGISESYVSFLLSLSLFSQHDVEYKLPKTTIDFLTDLIKKDPDLYSDNALEYLNDDGKNLESRALILVLNLHKTRRWDIILPVYSFIITKIINSKNHNENYIQILSQIVNSLYDPLEEKAIEGIYTIRSLLIYADAFSKMIPNQWRDLISKISKLCIALEPTSDKSNINWAFQLIMLLSYMYLQSFSCCKISNDYVEFIKFLSNEIIRRQYDPIILQLMENMSDLLSIQYGRYPFPESLSFPSHIEQTITDKTTYPLFTNNNILLSLHFLENIENQSSKHTLQLMSQTNAGQFIWNFKDINQDFLESQPPKKLDFQFDIQDPQITKSKNSEEDISSIFDDIVKDYGKTFNDDYDLLSELKKDQNITQVINSVKASKEYYNSNAAQTSVQNHEAFISRKYSYKENPAAANLLSLGFLNTEYKHIFDLKMLKNNDHAKLLVRKAQVLNHRTNVKIGVLYVGREMEHQNDILATSFEETSPHFREFITGLGWPVDLTTHVGYDGGLDTSGGTNGRTSIYYADFMNEIMFHVSPLIPKDPNDSQQIYKKRHIGNDHVHIIWCENTKDYDVATITSQFNQAHIVIYPLSSGLFKVDTFWCDSLKWFGPLRFTSILTKTELPQLVRSTGVSAMKTFYDSQKESEFAYKQSEITNIFNELIPKEIETDNVYATHEELITLTPENL